MKYRVEFLINAKTDEWISSAHSTYNSREKAEKAAAKITKVDTRIVKVEE